MADDISMATVEVDEPPVASTSNAHIVERSHIRRGDTVLLQLPSKVIRLVKLSPSAGSGVLHLGRYGTFDCIKELVGKPYGVTYEVVAPERKEEAQDGEDPEEEDSEQQPDNQEGQEEGANGKSKRKLKRDAARNKGKDRDTGSNRQLSTLRRLEGVALEEIVEVTEATNEKIQLTGAKTLDPEIIMQMKREGVSGREIIDMQIAEHEAYALKNEFSKAKYKNRKEAKYLKYVTPLAPTIHNLCEYWWQLEPRRIRDLRPDTLAQMLAVGNIRPGSRVLVVDDASGLLTAAIVERLGGNGTVFVMHPHDSPPPNQCLPLLNMPEFFYSPDVLKSLHWGWTEDDWQLDEIPNEPDGEGTESERQRQRHRKRIHTQEVLKETIQDLKDGNFDALMVSSAFAPMSVLERVVPLLDGSAQIVFHSPVLQPLSDLLEKMIPDRSLLNPTIIEPWLRQYQVLPGRTHPTMNGIAHGGYLLHAVRVFDDPGISSARAAGLGQEARAKKRRRV